MGAHKSQPTTNHTTNQIPQAINLTTIHSRSHVMKHDRITKDLLLKGEVKIVLRGIRNVKPLLCYIKGRVDMIREPNKRERKLYKPNNLLGQKR